MLVHPVSGVVVGAVEVSVGICVVGSVGCVVGCSVTVAKSKMKMVHSLK